MAHLYWQFLAYQNHLDRKSTELDAQGKNGSPMRHHLQNKLGFSDGEFASIRTSSVRLTSEVGALDARAVAIRKAGKTPSNFNQLRALTVEREANINAEVSYLGTALPPDKRKALEGYLTQMLSPTNAVPMYRNLASTGGQR